MKENLIFISIVLICIASGFYLGTYLQKILPTINLPSFVTKCYFDFDCDWKITNCCPENSGARWECVNLKNFKEPACPSMVICPQVISPKPTSNCVCERGSCVVK